MVNHWLKKKDNVVAEGIQWGLACGAWGVDAGAEYLSDKIADPDRDLLLSFIPAEHKAAAVEVLDRMLDWAIQETLNYEEYKKSDEEFFAHVDAIKIEAEPFYYQRQLIQNEVVTIGNDRYETCFSAMKYLPDAGTIMGRVAVGGVQINSFQIDENGKFKFKVSEPIDVENCTINYKTGEIKISWQAWPSFSTYIELDYECDIVEEAYKEPNNV